MRINANEQCVVVQHLFEVWNDPSIIDAVSGKSSADLVVHPTSSHRLQRRGRHVQCRRTNLWVDAHSKEKFENHGWRKLGCPTKSSVLGIETDLKRANRIPQQNVQFFWT